MEREADEAEREVVTLKKLQFMQGKVGAEFQGFITGVTAFGFFVELKEYFVEGLVRLTSLHDDYYTYEEKRHALVGEHTGRVFRLGDMVEVKVERVDLERRQMDFSLAGMEEERPRRKEPVWMKYRKGGRR
jgi:ribonuclease R